jgi:hypothetical protein
MARHTVQLSTGSSARYIPRIPVKCNRKPLTAERMWCGWEINRPTGRIKACYFPSYSLYYNIGMILCSRATSYMTRPYS